MPQIYKPKYRKKYASVYKSKKGVIHNNVYNTPQWKQLRINKLIQNPLCEICESKGFIKSAIDVHHIIPISQGKSIKQMKELGFDYNNLKSLCKQCHEEHHQKEREKNKLYLSVKDNKID